MGHWKPLVKGGRKANASSRAKNPAARGAGCGVAEMAARETSARPDEVAQGAADQFVVALDEREVVGVDVGAVGSFEAGFEGGEALGEVVSAHETGIALHAVGDAVTVLAIAAAELGEGSGEIAQKRADERADVVLAEDGGEFDELGSGRWHTGHTEKSAPISA